MKKILFPVLILMLCISSGLGQKRISTDSLFILLEEARDTQRLTILSSIFDRLVYQYPDTGVYFASQIIDLSGKLEYTFAEAHGWYKHGMANAMKGNLVVGAESMLKSRGLFAQMDQYTGVAFAEKGIGNVLQMMDNLDRATEYFRASLQHYRQYGSENEINLALNSLALCFQENDMLDSAIHYHTERVELSRESGDRGFEASALNNLASTFKAKGEYGLAEQAFLESLKIREEQDARKPMAIVLGNLADLYRLEGDVAKSIEYFNASIRIREEIGDMRGIALNSNRLAHALMDAGRYEEAVRASERSAGIARARGYLDFEMVAIDRLKKIHEKQGNFGKALEYADQYIVLRDSLMGIEKSEQVAEMEAKYGVEKAEFRLAQQDKEISLLEDRNEAQSKLRFVLTAAAMLLLGLLIVLYNRYQLKQRSEHKLSEKNKQISRINSEIREVNKELERKMLRAQMDPHFIFNSLNSIQHFITINEKELAIRYLSKFAKLIRRVLDNSISDRVPLSDELSLLEDYMELEELRLNHSFTHEIEVDEEIDLYNTEVPFLIIQPYVENAIKHGLKQLKEQGKLSIRLEDGGAHLKCYIMDNGIGREAAMQNARNRHHRSHGMSVTRKRLEALNKANENKTYVEITDLKDEHGSAAGTRVALTIPYDLN